MDSIPFEVTRNIALARSLDKQPRELGPSSGLAGRPNDIITRLTYLQSTSLDQGSVSYIVQIGVERNVDSAAPFLDSGYGHGFDAAD